MPGPRSNSAPSGARTRWRKPPARARPGRETPSDAHTKLLELQSSMGNRGFRQALEGGHGSHKPPMTVAHLANRPKGAPEATTLPVQRQLVVDGEAVTTLADLPDKYKEEYPDEVQLLIDLPGVAVTLTAAELDQVVEFLDDGEPVTDRAAKIAVVQIASHGTWTKTATVGPKAAATLAMFNSANAMGQLGELGGFLSENPAVGKNLAAAGVGWELDSHDQNVGDLGGAAVIDDRIHIENWVVGSSGLAKMAVHEAGHATFQRMLIRAEHWTDEANKGKAEPDDDALVADGKRFYEAWATLRSKPRFFYVVDMPGNDPRAKGDGRKGYLAGQFSEFCADSFMHLALRKDDLVEHVAKLPETEGEIRQAWATALNVLETYEPRILGEDQDGADTLRLHRITAAIAFLDRSLNGPNLEVANIDDVRKNLVTLRAAWQALTPDEQAVHRGPVLVALDRYVMKVQRRRPAQDRLADELGFAGL